jgi:DNA invertase Pin-like site-specific DNA recombinase
MSTTYFLYARKSTDVEDKQVRSIDDQLAVLRALAKTEGLHIIEEFVEKQSAKIPGRPVFNEMIARIEKGEARGIICWKLDRLARNPVDGGLISWMIQRGIIQHIQTHDRSYLPTDNIVMMSVEFGMANQYIIDLSSNTKRGLYEKAKRGEYPGLAPMGYLNDLRTRLVIVNRKIARIVKRAFELYAEGNQGLQDIANFFASEGIKTKNGKPIKRDKISYILSNPFYIGLFRYGGELHEGKHEPIISKQLFDKVQDVLKARGTRPKHSVNDPEALCGLIRCGSCGMMITAEKKIKHQKNGNVHEYTYYRCTHKSKIIKCTEPAIREEELDRQLSTILKEHVLPFEWAAELSKMADKEEQVAINSSAALVQEVKDEIQDISEKLQRLLSVYLDQDIEQEAYRSEKASLLSRKKSLEEKMAQVVKGVSIWIEPLREWIKDAQTLNEITESTPLPLKKSFALKIFGLNPSKNSFGLTLHAREARGFAENQWAAIAAAHAQESETPMRLILVALFDAVSTYFKRKSDF